MFGWWAIAYQSRKHGKISYCVTLAVRTEYCRISTAQRYPKKQIKFCCWKKKINDNALHACFLCTLQQWQGTATPILKTTTTKHASFRYLTKACGEGRLRCVTITSTLYSTYRCAGAMRRRMTASASSLTNDDNPHDMPRSSPKHSYSIILASLLLEYVNKHSNKHRTTKSKTLGHTYLSERIHQNSNIRDTLL